MFVSCWKCVNENDSRKHCKFKIKCIGGNKYRKYGFFARLFRGEL